MRRRSLFTLILFVATHGAAAGPHEEGLAAGQAALAGAAQSVTPSSAEQHVPYYGQAAPEQKLDRQQLGNRARQRLQTCMGEDDPLCEAVTTAQHSANTPRPGVMPDAAAMAIQHDPASVLGSLDYFYSGCRSETRTPSADSVVRQCQFDSRGPSLTCRRELTVDITRGAPTCTEGCWIAHGRADRNGADHMVAEAQCRLQAGGQQRFRFYAWGGKGACIGWQTVDLPTTPSPHAQVVAQLAPHWQGYCWPSFKVVMAPGSGCDDTQCNYQFQFGNPLYGCGSSHLPGDRLQGYWSDSASPSSGSPGHCFSLIDTQQGSCPQGSYRLSGELAGRCARPQGPLTVTGASGWTIPLQFARPGLQHTEQDQWQDHCPPADSTSRCQPQGHEVCVDGPSTRLVQGIPVTRSCWAYERHLSCQGSGMEACDALRGQGCTLLESTCLQMEGEHCIRQQQHFRCPATAERDQNYTCPVDRFCLGSSCFNTASAPDKDFAQAMSLMEAGREAGVYLDTDNLQVFSGEPGHCRERLLKNCCGSESAGAGMSNNRLFGAGSRLVYDVLMNSENRAFISQGLQALMTSGGFSGAFTSYGITIAVNGTAVPAGSMVLASGGNVVVAVDPWTLAIAVVIYVVTSMMECSADEGKLALKQGAGLCHTVGEYCSTCLMVLGKCTRCIEYSSGKCCFNSQLARIINEQGRRQLGRGWGRAKHPQCAGFTVAELQRLDFAAMDLSEFYASIQPVLPDDQRLQERNRQRGSDCYYGQGRCP